MPDWFFYLKLKKRRAKAIYQVLNFLPSVFFLTVVVVMKFSDQSEFNASRTQFFLWINFALLLFYIPKLVYLIFHFINYLINLLFKKKTYVLRYMGAIIGVFIILMMCHGAFINTRNTEIRKVVIEVENLPQSFDGYKIVQISDIHLGSWDKDFSYIKPTIDSINAQNPDIIVFTGDMVNNFAEEMEGWQSYFIKLKAKEGKYAILGNHDYGDYSEWKHTDEKEKNLASIKQNMRDFGFTLLLNENVCLLHNGDSISLLGVGNWGKPPFPKYGNLKKALKNTDSITHKILLSHDPSHWRGEVLNYHQIFLTLSGHTHAGQMAFNIFGKVMSPSSLIYKEWNGLYKIGNQYLFINRGLGYIGIPFRIGAARPEITLITLKSKS